MRITLWIAAWLLVFEGLTCHETKSAVKPSLRPVTITLDAPDMGKTICVYPMDKESK